MMQAIPFAKNAYQLRSQPISAQRCVNLYPEIQPKDAKAALILQGTPGLKPFVPLNKATVRGLHVMAGQLYAVAGETLYAISESGDATALGFIAGSGRIMMSDNATQLVITTGERGYVYEEGVGLSEITSPAFYASHSVAFIDQYFIFERKGTGQFFLSNLSDATQFDALDFATAEGAPDDTIRVLADHRELWLFGERSIEVWVDIGDAIFPFERINGGLIERGCAARFSPAKMDNSVYWLGEDGIVYRAQGYQPQRISTHAIEAAIKAYGDVSEAFAYCYIDEGHAFYVLTFPGHTTWVYDAATALWHERRHFKSGRHRGHCYVKAYGRHLVGDFENGQIYELSLDCYDDAGDVIQRIATSPPLFDGQARITMSRLVLEMESGVGLITGQGSQPQAMLSWSDDGGRRWTAEHWQSIGTIGDTLYRVVWRRLGQFRSRVFRLMISDPIKVVIINAYAELRRDHD